MCINNWLAFWDFISQALDKQAPSNDKPKGSDPNQGVLISGDSSLLEVDEDTWTHGRSHLLPRDTAYLELGIVKMQKAEYGYYLAYKEVSVTAMTTRSICCYTLLA